MASFRNGYLGYDELTHVIHGWAAEHPDLVRVTSLGLSLEGRHLWLLTIGPDPDRIRPAAWVDGNMHASEVAGSSVALAIAEEVIHAHTDRAGVLDLPAHVVDWIRAGVLFYILPRMSPDGAERVLSTGAYVRSNPRDRRLGRSAPFWKTGDVDGDGRAVLMRREDPAGDFVASSEVPGLMLPRRLEDPGPYYVLVPEGIIENWDGFTVPTDHFLGDNDTDLNRNFPYQWAPEPHQVGAGHFATSEPESRAVAEFAVAHPNIFAWLNLHTFGGCYIRPLGDKSDKLMDQSDLAVYRQIGEWTEKLAGYPMVSGFEEFTYEPDKPIAGELCAFAHGQRGAVGMVCELWDFWKQAGLPVLRPFVHNYDKRSIDDILAMARWDRDHNGGRIVGSWKRFEHPQLGPVDIGGFDPRFGIWNPPEDRLAEVCENQARVFLRIAAMAPRIALHLRTKPLGEGLTQIEAVVQNLGYLPTHVLSSARSLPWNGAVRARLDGLALASGVADQEIGHLAGWGAHEQDETPAFARTTGHPSRGRATWVVRGKGRVHVSAGSARLGRVEASVEVE